MVKRKVMRSGALALLLVLSVFLLLPLAALAAEPPAESLRYQRDLIRNSRAVWGLDAPVATFAAQIHQESRWRPDARSPVGAQGLAQFMPATSEWISGVYKWDEPQPYNPAWAMRALVTYDQWIWQRIKANDDCQRMAMTLSAYNGGLGWVYRDQALAAKHGQDRGRWFGSVEKYNAGRHAAAFKENRGYPRNILLRWQPLYARWGSGVACA
jgi:soluble lytic murein transglycosylase-like protein